MAQGLNETNFKVREWSKTIGKSRRLDWCKWRLEEREASLGCSKRGAMKPLNGPRMTSAKPEPVLFETRKEKSENAWETDKKGRHEGNGDELGGLRGVLGVTEGVHGSLCG
ncbi:hypothetical protein CRG98_034662 [Punica granatum]|uniref:Uncharacterized protein n=1 Tax=Punica granatum TaxID=22663 RepID=A0A2I0ILU4_PUNGR|nr:hypothetical protein CRG98_034662 [Punica granatum]